MARDENGFLKEDALRTAGIADQYAVVKGDKRHEVSIVHDDRQGGIVLQHVILDIETEVREVHAWQVGENLAMAQGRFRAIVRSLGGRA